jgi:hypothetical protein
MATIKQIDLIKTLCDRILAVDARLLPTKAKAKYPACYTYNPQANAIEAQKIALELLSRLSVERLSVGTAMAWIADLKVQARRCGL